MPGETIPLTPRGIMFRSLSYDLRCMRQRPIETKEGLDAWYTEVQQFRLKLGTTYHDIAHLLPHELEHYLDDADIRAKNAGYRQDQEKFLDDLLGFIAAQIKKECAKDHL